MAAFSSQKKIMKEEKEVLYDIYAKETFVKVKQALGIGKMLFSFVNKTSKEHIDVYLLAEEFGALLMNQIKSGSLFKKIAEEKAKGDKYPKAVWTSPFGGFEEKSTGKCFSRSFTISPGSNAELILTATQYPATKTETGAFVPVQGSKPTITIRVPASFNDFLLMNYAWEYLAKDYFTRKYSVANMQPARNNGNNNKNTTSDAPGGSNSSQKRNSAESNQNAPKAQNEAVTERKEATSAPSATVDINTYRFKKNSTQLLLMQNGYDQCIKAIDEEGNEYIIIFPLQVTEKETKWSSFENAIKKGATSFSILATKNKSGNLRFCSFA